MAFLLLLYIHQMYIHRLPLSPHHNSDTIGSDHSVGLHGNDGGLIWGTHDTDQMLSDLVLTGSDHAVTNSALLFYNNKGIEH